MIIFYRKKFYIMRFRKRLKIFANMRFHNVLLKNRINQIRDRIKNVALNFRFFVLSNDIRNCFDTISINFYRKSFFKSIIF